MNMEIDYIDVLFVILYVPLQRIGVNVNLEVRFGGTYSITLVPNARIR